MKKRREKNLKVLFFLFVLILINGCGPTSPESMSPPFLHNITIFQIGKSFFISPFNHLDVKKAQKPIPVLYNFQTLYSNSSQIFLPKKFYQGAFLSPKKKCILLKGKTFKELCLREVPSLFPHIKILKVDSSQIKFKILSILPKSLLIIKNKKRHWFVLLENNREYKIINPELNVTYSIRGGILFKEKDGFLQIVGPLSNPIIIKVKDSEPPLPPSGGGYALERKKLLLLWGKSPSPDVSYYLVTFENLILKTKENFYVLKLSDSLLSRLKKSKIWICKVQAVDRAGNKSYPLLIKIRFAKKMK